jgi:P27 family predicted phage terminase small subunit
MKNSKPKVPISLTAEGKTMWVQLQEEYDITDLGGLVILTAACESFDRMRAAQRIVDVDGMTTSDRFGQAKVHPAVIVERDARAAMLAALKQLHLDLEPIKPRGRPPGVTSITY